MVLPIFLSSPLLVSGIPVFRDTLLFSPLIPNNLFQEKENPYFFSHKILFIL